MATSNTGENRPGTFKKGDARINRKGRPKSFDALRELAQQIAHEEAKGKDGQIIINGKIATVTEVILRSWATSKDPRQQQAFIEIAYGKTPTVVTGKDDGPIAINISAVDYRQAIAPLAPEPDDA